jgi:uncharacterized membrane protein YvbJ
MELIFDVGYGMIILLFEGGSSMVCPNCGMENEEEVTVCAQCGERLVQSKRNYGKDFAWAALALGIWSMIFYPYLYAPLAVLAAAVAHRQNFKGKMHLAGVICGLVALVGWAVFRILT